MGVMLWPELNLMWTSVDCVCASNTPDKATTSKDSLLSIRVRPRAGADARVRPEPTHGSALLLSGGRRRRLRAFARVELRFVFVVGHVVPANPREAHLIDRPVALADPVARIRVALARGVVVPADDVQYRARRINRRDIVGVHMDDVPVEGEVRTTEQLGLVVWIDQ